jgi:DNA-binding MarR family transcriptional regulator
MPGSPVLETSGLIYQEQDPNDKRKILISPSTFFGAQHQNNSDAECGVDTLLDNHRSELDEF